MIQVVHTLRIALVVALLIGLHLWSGRQIERNAIENSELTLDKARTFFSTAERLVPPEGSLQPWGVLDRDGKLLGYLIQTSPYCDPIIGYAGPSNLLIALDEDQQIARIAILSSQDTFDHVRKVRYEESFWNQFIGWNGTHPPPDQIDGVSGATLTSLAMAESIVERMHSAAQVGDSQQANALSSNGTGSTSVPVLYSRKSLKFPEDMDLERVSVWFPEAASIVPSEDHSFLLDVRDGQGKSLGRFLRTSYFDDSTIGYQGPTEVLILLDPQNRAVDFQWLKSFDNEPYTRYVRQERSFWKKFKGLTIQDIAAIDFDEAEIDGVSGATMTSMAVAETLRNTSSLAVKALAEASLKSSSPTIETTVKTTSAPVRPNHWNFSWSEWATGVVAIAALFWGRSKWRGNKKLRVGWQVLCFVLLGIMTGNLLSLALLDGWTRGGVPYRLAPGLTLLLAVSLLTPAVTKRNVYCDHLCPHGILQQWIRYLPWCRSRSIKPWVSKIMQVSSLVMIGWIVIGIAMQIDTYAAWLEPFDTYAWRIGFSVSAIVWIASVLLTFWQPMSYCRLACPTGKFLGFIRLDASKGKWRWSDSFLAIVTLLVFILLWQKS